MCNIEEKIEKQIEIGIYNFVQETHRCKFYYSCKGDKTCGCLKLLESMNEENFSCYEKY